jgi:hypothetical protein
MPRSLFRRFGSDFARAPRQRVSARPRLEQLEGRAVPSVSFGSAFRIGPDSPTKYTDGWGRGIIADSAGNVYTTGSFAGILDFDPSHPGTDGILTSRQNASGALVESAYVAKYDPNGGFLWARQMGGDAVSGPLDLGQALAMDTAGNVYVVGEFSSNAYFGSFHPTSGDVFVTKLDASGNFQWVQTYTDYPYSGRLQDIAVDPTGNVYVARSSSTSHGSTNVFLYVDKLDTNGVQQWEGRFGNTGSENYNTGTGIKADAAGNVFVTGTFTGTVDFNPGNGSSTLTSPKVKGRYVQEGFVLELTTANSFVWAKEIASMPNDIALDGSDNVYTTGASGNSVQGGTGGPLNATKLSSTGALLWSKNFANGGYEGPGSFGVAVDGGGNVFLTGYFTATTNFNPAGTFNLTSAGSRDIFVCELDTNGKFVWAGAMGGAGTDEGFSIALYTSPNKIVSIYTTGFYGAYVAGVTDYRSDFDPGPGVYDLSPTSGREIFVSTLIDPAKGHGGSSSSVVRSGGSTASAARAAAGHHARHSRVSRML